MVFSGCSSASSNENNDPKKIHIGIITGKIGDEYLLKTKTGELINTNSRVIKLEEYINKDAKFEGMYSGDTFYVDAVLN